MLLEGCGQAAHGADALDGENRTGECTDSEAREEEEERGSGWRLRREENQIVLF